MIDDNLRYSGTIPDERLHDMHRDLRSPMGGGHGGSGGSGPRGAGVFLVDQVFTRSQGDTYQATKSVFLNPLHKASYGVRIGDIVLFYLNTEGILCTGIVTAISDETVTFVKHDEISTVGFSPSIATTDIPGGHRVTVTNEGGSNSFDVMDGVQGPQGKPFEFDDFTQAQLDELRSDVASVYYRKQEATVINFNDVSTIGIPFDNFTFADMLFVDIEGLALTENQDYVINGSTIELTTPITHPNTRINFKLLTIMAITSEDLDTLLEGLADFNGATDSADGTHGLVPAPAAGDDLDVLFGNGEWGALNLTTFSWGNDQSISIQANFDNEQAPAALFGSTSLPLASATKAGLMKLEDYSKLQGIQAGAQANVIESISINGTAVDVNNKNAAISIPQASSDSAGLMAASDKTKLNGIEAGANAYALPVATTVALGGVKPDGTTVTVDNDGTIHAAGSGTIPDGSITGVKIADDTIPDAKLAQTGGVLSAVDALRSDINIISDENNIASITDDTLIYCEATNMSAVVEDGTITLTRLTVSNPTAGIMFNGLTVGKTYSFSLDVVGTLLSVPNVYQSVTSLGSFSGFIGTMTLVGGSVYSLSFTSPATTIAVKIDVKYNATTVTVSNPVLYTGNARIIDNDAIASLGLSNLDATVSAKISAIYGLSDFFPTFSAGYIDKTTGNVTTAIQYECTVEYIPLVVGGIRRVIQYEAMLGYSASIAVYDSDKTLLYTIHGPSDSTATVTGEISDGYYVRFSKFANTSHAQSFTVTDLTLEESGSDDAAMVVSMLNGVAVTGGSRECILVQFPNGKNLLMDTGWASTATEVKNQILSRGVTKFDYLMITHYHSDHAGGLEQWLNDGLLGSNGVFSVDGCIAYLPPEITAANIAECWRTEGADGVTALVDRQNAIVSGLTNLGVTIVRPAENQTVNVGNAVMRFWNCDHTPYSSDQGSTYLSSNYNDFSICCQIEYGSMSFNNTADIGPIAQSYMGGKLRKCVFMTGPHHGWDNGVNSLKPEFINNVNPDVVVSPNGSPHYPSAENTNPANVLNASSPLQSWCERNNVANYMTCINGPIDITFWQHGWKFNGAYSKFIRNGKNWKWTDNSEYVEQ